MSRLDLSFLEELPRVRRLPWLRSARLFELEGRVYKAERGLGSRDTREPLLLARRWEGAARGERVLVERLHRPEYGRINRHLLSDTDLALRLSHPTLQRLLQVAEHGERRYAVWEYTEGRSLASLLALAPLFGPPFLPPEVACFIAAQVADALHLLHTRTGAAGAPPAPRHGEVRPALIRLGWDGRVQLAGFGTRWSRVVGRHDFARHWDRDMLEDNFYRDPAGEPEDRHAGRADLYALAVVLLEMLWGLPPWVGLEQVEPRTRGFSWKKGLHPRSVEQVLGGLRLQKELACLVLKALQPEPGQRFPSAQELGQRLRMFACGAQRAADALCRLTRQGVELAAADGDPEADVLEHLARERRRWQASMRASQSPWPHLRAWLLRPGRWWWLRRRLGASS